MAPPSTSHAEFGLNLISTTALIAASSTVGTSTSAARPSWIITAAISASEATLTPSSTALASFDRRMRGTSGPLTATNAKAGKKMPSVAIAAPLGPPRT